MIPRKILIPTFFILVALILFALMAMASVEERPLIKPFETYDELRTRGELNNPMGSTSLVFCDVAPALNCRTIGRIDEKNVIHWDADVGPEILKKIIQSYQDQTVLHANRMLRATKQNP